MIYKITETDSKIIKRLRGIFIVLVVFIHTSAYTGKGYVDMAGEDITLNVPEWLWNLEYIISRIIAHVAVPGFFVIAAVLLYRKVFTWKNNTVKKIKALIVPYLIVISFWIVLYAIMQSIPFAKPFFSNESKLIADWGVFQFVDAYLGITQMPLVYPLWFIQNLFFLNLIALPIQKIIDAAPKVVFVILWVLLLAGPDYPVFCVRTSALVYFCMGYYLVKYDIHFEQIAGIKLEKVSILYLITCVSAFFLRDTYVYAVLDNLNICCGLAWMIVIAVKIKEGRLINSLSKYSFNIFILHEMYLRMAVKAASKVLGVSVIVQFAQYFVIPFLVIMFCIGLSVIMERITPRFYKVLIGARK